MRDSKRDLLRYIAEKKEEARRRYAVRRAEIGDMFRRSVGDYGDEVKASETMSDEFALAERELLRYRLLEDAEQRLLNDDYRRCAACGKYIELARYFAIPETTMCCACSQEMDPGGRFRSRFREDVAAIQSHPRGVK